MSSENLPAEAAHWTLDPEVIFLNHGSFGACPRPVLETQTRFRERMEAQPVRFLHRELEEELDAARVVLSRFLGADPEGLAFVANATTGVNTVLRGLHFEAGDRILVTDQAYNACKNALDYVAERAAAEVLVVPLPFPLASAEEVSEAILTAAEGGARLALIDHVTSPTGLVLPMSDIVTGLAERGIDCLVDGAHAPGMLDLDLGDLGAAYYTGNCHKWLCAPKGSAFLHVREDRREGFRPLVISHGANSPRRDRSRYLLESGWTGTDDPSAWLSIPKALDFMSSLCPGGWPELREHNRNLVLRGRDLLCAALGIDAPCPENMIGSLASVPLGDSEQGPEPLFEDPLQVELRE
ncbi:MAG: aminotransferase class V-fold PLP-dependent enzyme, partial [Planctomycetota bacterium]